MIEFDPARCVTTCFAHQAEGTRAILSHDAFALFDEMGAGKSKQVIDAACALAAAGALRLVVVVAPASVRGVWLDAEGGEIRKHAWALSRVLEYHSPRRGSRWRESWKDELYTLSWVVTNYEFLRQDENLKMLMDSVDRARPVMLVLDESTCVANSAAKQTRAIAKLRARCDRCVLLTGTPVAASPLGLWSQFCILDRRILAQFHNFWHFRARYAVMGGWQQKNVVAYQNLPELMETLRPHALRRLKANCLDLPEKVHTWREVRLRSASWRTYQQFKREALLALPDGPERVEPNATVRILRLCQLVGGSVGTDPDPDDPRRTVVCDLSSEKIDWLVNELLESDVPSHTIVWCRFRRERERIVERVGDRLDVYQIYGGQDTVGRAAAVRAFGTNSSPPSGNRRTVLVAQPHAGGFGLNLTAATRVYYFSNDFSLTARLQSEDRCHRPGQKSSVTYVDILAVGPEGQRTVDHVVWRALARKQKVATWTSDTWRRELEED